MISLGSFKNETFNIFKLHTSVDKDKIVFSCGNSEAYNLILHARGNNSQYKKFLEKLICKKG